MTGSNTVILSDLAREALRTWAICRIEAMSKTPAIWAASREGFGLQLALILEIVLGLTPAQATVAVFETQGNIVCLDGELDANWTLAVCAQALYRVKTDGRAATR